MLLIIIPILCFIVISSGMYYITPESNTKKNKFKHIFTRNILPGITVGLLVFILIKYKDSRIFNPEPVMGGNYFD